MNRLTPIPTTGGFPQLGPRTGFLTEQVLARPGQGNDVVFEPGRPVRLAWIAFTFANNLPVLNNQTRLSIVTTDYTLTIALCEVEPLITVDIFCYAGGPSPNLASSLNLSGICGLPEQQFRSDAQFRLTAVNMGLCIFTNIVFFLAYDGRREN
jgi:hypothetical protein